MDSDHYLTIVRRRWRLIAFATLVGVAAALVFAPTADVSYTAVHRLIVEPAPASSLGADVGGGRGETLETRTSSTAALITGAEVARRAAEKVEGDDDAGALRKHIDVSTEPKAGLISVTARAETAQRAVDIADAFATELIAYLSERAAQERQEALDFVNERMVQLQGRLTALDETIDATTDDEALAPLLPQRAAVQSEITTLSQTLDSLSSAGSPEAGVSTLEHAEARLATERLRLPSNDALRMALLGATGLLLGLGLALVVDRQDTRLRTKEEAEKAFAAPVLAEIPWISGWTRRREEVFTQSNAPAGAKAAEAYRSLRTSLQLMQHAAESAAARTEARAGADVLLVTSPNPSEGKSTTVANLAATFAEAGNRVVVLNCDLRQPRMEQYLRTDNGVGVSDVLAGGPKAPQLRDVVVDTEVAGVRLVPAGSLRMNPTELFARGHQILARSRELADIVIFDTPPLLRINDASELIPVVDEVVLVARAGRTTAESASRATELLRRLGAPLSGVVLVGGESPGIPSSYYYYSSQQPRSRWRHPALWFRRGGRRPPPRGAQLRRWAAGPSRSFGHRNGRAPGGRAARRGGKRVGPAARTRAPAGRSRSRDSLRARPAAHDRR